MKHLKFLSVVSLILLLTACKKDDDNNENTFDGSITSIENFFNPEILDAMQDLGFTINTGDNPPSIIEGSYIATPFILENSSVIGDNVGMTFSDYIFEFSNQNNDDLTIDFQGNGGGQVDEGFGSFIAGSDNKFSVFLKITSTFQGETAEFAYAMSGKVSSDGIIDYEFINLMLDDNGDPSDIWIENNTGRLIVDSDGFSPLL